MRNTIDGATLRKMILSAAASVENHKQQINELNVFPVPDGDTGTNMSMTLNAAADELRKAGELSLTKAADKVNTPNDMSNIGNDGLPGWAIALIIVGAVVVVAVVVIIIVAKKKGGAKADEANADDKKDDEAKGE